MRYKRVSRSHHCPVCDHDTWCTYTDDGREAKCMRVPSDRPLKDKHGEFGGYMHVLDASIPRARYQPPPPLPPPNFAPLAKKWFQECEPEHLLKHAQRLGVAFPSLHRLRTGWAPQAELQAINTPCNARGCWAYPMRLEMVDGNPGQVVGVRLRPDHGKKYSVTGSREGLFYAHDHDLTRGAVIVEGASDCAALLDLGFQAIGRPHCRGGVVPCIRMCRDRETVVIGDFDKPDKLGRCAGQEGAKALVEALKPGCRSVRLCWPPEGFKDVREWIVKAKADRNTVLRHIFDTAE